MDCPEASALWYLLRKTSYTKVEGKFGLFGEDVIVGMYTQALEILGLLDDSQHSSDALFVVNLCRRLLPLGSPW